MSKKNRISIFLLLLIGMVIIITNSCKKDDSNPPTDDSGTVTDVDGNVYHTVTIGKQIWMVENLRTTHYNDSTAIPNLGGNSAWQSNTTGAYCWYNNDGAAAINSPYGALYNWYAVNTYKLCPKGWHVPFNAEWDELINFLGGTSVAGGKLKEAGTTHWTTPNTGADNSSGFTALPGGYRLGNGQFGRLREWGHLWGASDDNTINAWECGIDFEESSTYRNYNNKGMGFSVRCIKGQLVK